MDIKQFEIHFNEILKEKYKTKDLDLFNKSLIKAKTDVSFLKDIVFENNKYHRTYFQVSLALIEDVTKQLKFIEDNFELLNDWWHVDQLTQFLSKDLTLNIAYKHAKKYVKNSNLFARRWAYVLFMPTLVKDKEAFDIIISLLKDDKDYYVIMAQAWLISYLAIYHPDQTLNYLLTKPLKYNIISKAIQKICDSYRISSQYKEKFKQIRSLYK